MKLAADNTLIPCVKMGVEARQQVCRDGTLEDAAITSKNHPLRSRLGSNGRRFVTNLWQNHGTWRFAKPERWQEVRGELQQAPGITSVASRL